MTKIRLATGVLVLGVSVAGVVSATPSQINGQGPRIDLLVGSARLPIPTPLGTFPGAVSYDAKSDDPILHTAVGHFRADIFTGAAFGTVSFSGDVICLQAVGAVASVQGVVTDSNSVLVPPGLGLLARVVDNGQGANDPADQEAGFLTPPPGPTPSCPLLPFATVPVTQGNFVVRDGI